MQPEVSVSNISLIDTLAGPWEIWKLFYKSILRSHFTNWYLVHFLYNRKRSTLPATLVVECGNACLTTRATCRYRICAEHREVAEITFLQLTNSAQIVLDPKCYPIYHNQFPIIFVNNFYKIFHIKISDFCNFLLICWYLLPIGWSNMCYFPPPKGIHWLANLSIHFENIPEIGSGMKTSNLCARKTIWNVTQ